MASATSIARYFGAIASTERGNEPVFGSLRRFKQRVAVNSASAEIASLLDREAAMAVVLGYACALDARDWPAYRALFTDGLEIDYASIGSIAARVAADEWTERCRALEGFDATAHQLHNLACVIDGETARVTSIVDAIHFVTADGRVATAQLIGRYRHDLQRGASGWLITGVALAVVGYPGGKAAFEAGFAAARDNFASRRIA